MIISDEERDPGIKLHLTLHNTSSQDIGEAITCYVDGAQVKESEGATIALPGITGPVTVELSGPSYYRATKYLTGAEESVTVELFPLPTSLGYHTQEEMEAVFDDVIRRCPQLGSRYSIGASLQSRSLEVLRLSAGDVTKGAGVSAKESVKLVGGIHGNEAVGRECLINLVQYLCGAYQHDDLVTKLLDTLDLHVLPSFNPDGFAVSKHGDDYWTLGRENANNADLNRNFPDQFGRQSKKVQPETSAMMSWSRAHNFTASISLHGGSLVACYPYDNTETGSSVYSASPDDETFIYLAKSYANTHPTMHRGDKVCMRGTDYDR